MKILKLIITRNVIKKALLAFVMCFLLLHFQKVEAQEPLQNYPRITGYFSIASPIATLNKDGLTYNYASASSFSFPFGINILKSDQFGFSFEFAPGIRSEKGITKVNSVLFHPGTMFRFTHGFTIITRLAFETSGRFGFTPVFNKVLKRNKTSTYFVSLSLPARFGNAIPASIGTGLQLGIGF